MTKIIKMCDLSKGIILKVFMMLNPEKVSLVKTSMGYVIVTATEPKDLYYPEGWYYAKGTLRNKHTSTTIFYEEIPMLMPNGNSWGACAKYCTEH